jgi:hypothetical protein
MFAAHAPIIFAVSGAVLVIFSAAITGIYSTVADSKIAKLEKNIFDADRKLKASNDSIQKSYQHFFPSEIKLLIIQMANSQADTPPYAVQAITKGIVQGILERSIAAYDEGPSQEKFAEYRALAQRANQFDNAAFDELSSISESLLEEWAVKYRERSEEKDQNEIQLNCLKRKVVRSRYLSVSLQILGLVLVLIKDVLAGSMA